MQSLKAERLELIAFVSLSLSPSAPDLFKRSDPAKSTRTSAPSRVYPP